MRQGGEEGDDALSAVRGEGCESQAFNGGTLNADASALSSTDLKVNTFQDDPAGRLLDGNTKVDEDSPSTNTAARDTMTLGSPRRSTSHSPSLSSSRSPSQGSNATTASASPVYDATNVPAGVSQKVIPDWTLELIGDGDVVMAVVFSFLDVESIVHCERACSRWRSASMRHDEVVWLPHWIKMTLASSRTNAINNLALPTLRSNVLHHKRLQCNATAMASLFAGYGTIPVTGVESTHKLPGPAFGQNAGGKRHIQIVVGPGVVGGRGDQDETETQRAYFLSAHPVGLSSVDLLDPALTDMQTWDQQTTLPRVTRHLELSKRLCSMPTASGGKWVPVSAWTPGLSGVGESFFFLSTTVGGGTPLKTQFEGGSQDDLPASRRLIRSYSMPKFDDIRGVPFSRSEMGVDLKLDWESQSNRRILRLDLPIEYGDSVGCLNDDTFIVAFHSGLAVHAAESLGPFDDDQDPFDDFFSKKPITHSPPSSPFDKTTPPSSPSSSPRLRRKRSSSLLRRQLSTQSLTNLSPSPSSAHAPHLSPSPFSNATISLKPPKTLYSSGPSPVQPLITASPSSPPRLISSPTPTTPSHTPLPTVFANASNTSSTLTKQPPFSFAPLTLVTSSQP
ncbi:hypothetical protein BC829DRAFT_224785 [Chytridium lagenaria]|nr:hypothetical protein BC829DRAFT_224785 [Chytridium lagenaria]